MADQYAVPQQASGKEFAGWGSRVAASIIDVVPTVVVFVLALVVFGTSETTDNSFSFQLTGVGALVYYAFAIGWFIYNVGVLQGRSGQSIGKKVLGISVGRVGSGEPLGLGLSIGRQFVHIVDALPCYLGFLWPLWDQENRTFTDMILETRVYRA